MESMRDMEKQLTTMLQEAMKAGEKNRLMALRSVKSVLTTERTRHSGPMSEESAIKTVASHRKKMVNAREQYASAGRDDLVAQADREIAVCDELLPPPVDQETVERTIDEIIRSTGASSPNDLGKVMGRAMKELAGKVDGNEVRRLVLQKLSK